MKTYINVKEIISDGIYWNQKSFLDKGLNRRKN